MTPEVEKLFHELADLAPPERNAYFAAHRIPDDVRRMVENLLSFDTGPNESWQDASVRLPVQ